jgi:hypothetical protein
MACWRLREVRAPAQSEEQRMPRSRQTLTIIVNGFAVLVIATAAFLTLANLGLISRSVTEIFTVGG